MKSIYIILIFLFVSTSSFVVSIESYFLIIHYACALLLFISMTPLFIRNNLLEKKYIKVIGFYYVAIIFSSFLGFLITYIFDDSTFKLLEISMYGRIANIILFSILSWYLVSLAQKNKILTVSKLVKFYSIGCFFLILTGYWQAITIYLGFGSFPFETRSMIHGYGKTDYDIEGRLTGIAAEPSYFVPFVLDFMILSLLVFRNSLLKIVFFSIAAFILALSFSPSGYMSFLGAFSLALLFTFNFKSKKYFYFLSTIVIICFITIINFIEKFKNISYVFGRLENITEDVRFQTISEIFHVFTDTNFMTILFGYGVTNLKFASYHTNFSRFETSNNLFFDILIEMGIVGLLLIICIFIRLHILIRSARVTMLQKFVSYALYFDLLITGLVRADYASSRFFIILAMLYLLSKFDITGNKKYEY